MNTNEQNAREVGVTSTDLLCAYAFQYFADGRMIEDTGLITLDEAKELWNKYAEHITERAIREEVAEMCIWSNMSGECDYHTAKRHLYAADIVIKNGCGYTLEPIIF